MEDAEVSFVWLQQITQEKRAPLAFLNETLRV